MITDLVFDDPRRVDPAVVGHKFARQSILKTADFPVPGFFVIPAEAFDDALAGATAPPAKPPAAAQVAGTAVGIEAWAAWCRTAILRRGVAEPLAAAIERGHDRLAGQHGLVAVRACIVGGATSRNDRPGADGNHVDAGEDGTGDPLAGLSDSFLYVRREDVVRRVAECWASAFSARAVHYQQQRGIDWRHARVAVGVQRMIDGKRSFVAFTRDPRDGADRRVIAAAYGIGEGVVAERADIDHFFADPHGVSVQAAVVPKARMIGLDPANPGAGPRELPVPAALSQRPVLTEDEVRQICALADRAEACFGVPQDIEGTLTADGEIHLVQARPMVPSATAPMPSRRRVLPDDKIRWTNHNVTESFPGVTSTLTFSQACQFYELAFGGFYRRMGVRARDLRRHDAWLGQMIGRINGRVYYRLDAWYELHGLIPIYALLRPTWQRAIGLSGDELTDAPPLRYSLRALARTAPRMVAMFAVHPWAIRRFLRWWDRFAATAGVLDGCDMKELAARHRQIWSGFGKWWPVTLVNSFFLLASQAVAERLLRRWAGDASPAMVGALLHGGRPNRSLAALRSALSVAEQMRASPELRQTLGTGDDQATYAQVSAGRFGADLADAVSEHLRRYGDRTMHDLKLEVRTPRQDPAKLIALLSPLVEQDMTVADLRDDERCAAQDGDERLRRACPDPVRRLVLTAVLATTRRLIQAREDTRFCRSQLYGLTRDIVWRLGEALTAAGWLDAAADVMHLTVPEVLDAADGRCDTAALRGLVAQRRADLEASASLQAPPAYLRLRASELLGDPSGPAGSGQVRLRPPSQAAAVPVASTLHGLASSAGVVRARARVVLEPTVEAGQCRDRIIVARETDPGWLYLMMAARGIVVERGSLLSHTAITGRLLGIPAVVAVRDATNRITDGAWLELDGAAGTVRLLDDAEACG